MTIVILYDSNNQLSSIQRRRIVGVENYGNHNDHSRSITLEMDDHEFCRLVHSSDQNLMQVYTLETYQKKYDHNATL